MIAACACAMTGVARAEHLGVIALDGRAAPVERAELARRAAAIAGDATTDVLSTAAANLRAGAVAAATLERFTQVRAAAEQAWQAFLQVQPEAAEAQLSRARRDAEELVPLAGGVELYADISLRLGAVLDYQGKKTEAGVAIRTALALDPERALTEREFSPDVLAAVDAARAVAPPTRTVKLDASTPARTKVELEIDGVDRGTAPIELELPHGDHIAVARSPGHVARALAFTVDATASTDLAIALDPDPYAAAAEAGIGRDTSDARATAAVEAGLLFGEVDAVLVVATTWQRDEPTLLVQRCAGTPVRCTAIVEIGYHDARGLDAALESAIADASAAGATLVASTLATDERLDTTHTERCFTCHKWTIAGISAAAIAAGVLAFVLLYDPPQKGVIYVDPMQL